MRGSGCATIREKTWSLDRRSGLLAERRDPTDPFALTGSARRLIRRTGPWDVHGHNDKTTLHLREGVSRVFRNQHVIAFGNSPGRTAFELGTGAVFVVRAPFVLQFAADGEDTGSIHHVNDLGLHVVDVGVSVDSLHTVF